MFIRYHTSALGRLNEEKDFPFKENAIKYHQNRLMELLLEENLLTGNLATLRDLSLRYWLDYFHPTATMSEAERIEARDKYNAVAARYNVICKATILKQIPQ